MLSEQDSDHGHDATRTVILAVSESDGMLGPSIGTAEVRSGVPTAGDRARSFGRPRLVVAISRH